MLVKVNSDLVSGRTHGNGKSISRNLLTDGSFATTPTSPRNKPYCAWRVSSRADVAQLIGTSGDASVLHSLEFRKQNQAGISAIFEMQSETGSVLGVLDCLFMQSQTPADITVSQWLSIVGSNIELETSTQETHLISSCKPAERRGIPIQWHSTCGRMPAIPHQRRA